MPVKFGRLGLGESPWEHVRNHAFEWGGMRAAYGGGGTQRGGAQKAEARKNGAPLPQPVKPAQPVQLAGGRHPASCLFFTLDYSDLAAV